MDRLLSPGRVARLLSVSERRVRAWVRRGVLTPSVVLPGGLPRWTAADVAVWVGECGRRSQTSQSGESEPEPEQAGMASDLEQWVREQQPGQEFTADEAARGSGYSVPASGAFRTVLRTLADRGLVTRIPGNRGFRVV